MPSLIGSAHACQERRSRAGQLISRLFAAPPCVPSHWRSFGFRVLSSKCVCLHTMLQHLSTERNRENEICRPHRAPTAIWGSSPLPAASNPVENQNMKRSTVFLTVMAIGTVISLAGMYEHCFHFDAAQQFASRQACRRAEGDWLTQMAALAGAAPILSLAFGSKRKCRR